MLYFTSGFATFFFFNLLERLRKAHLDLSVSYGIGLCNRLIIHWQLKRKERKIIRWEQSGDLYCLIMQANL